MVSFPSSLRFFWLVCLLSGILRAEVDPVLRDLVETRIYSRGRPVHLEFTPDGNHVLFLRSGPRDDRRALYEFSMATGGTREVLTAAKLLGGADEVISSAEKARRERMRLTASGLADFHLSKDGNKLLIPLANRLFVLNRTNGATVELKASEGAIDPQWSPDGKSVGFVVGHDVFVAEVPAEHLTALTHGGTDLVSFGLAEFVAQEEMARMHGFWWAPDSQSMLIERADARGVETWRVQDPMNPNRIGEAQFYPRPGQSNVVVELGVFPISGEAPRWLQWDRERFPYVASVDWHERGGLTLQIMSRDQKELVLLMADPKTGATHRLLSVQDEAWVNFVPGLVQWSKDGSSFIWATEHENSWQLELRTAQGQLQKILVPDSMGMRLGENSKPHLDAESGKILFSTLMVPTRSEVWLTDLSGTSPIRLDSRIGSRTGLLGSHGSYAIASSGPHDSPVWTVHRADGSVAGVLPSVAVEPSRFPNVEFARVGQGMGYESKLVRPEKFDATKRYPVIAAVYGGPGMAVVGQSFGGFLDQWLADQGFIVVSADGRGTPGRGRAWERAITNRFGDLPLSETINAIQALGERYPELDLNRVGITGWSFGGYLSAAAALRRPDFFKAAIAGAPVTDWMDYDTCYTERYLGVPGPEDSVYSRNSLIWDAPNLKCPLLLIHGTTDDNVFFRHSLKLADALFRSGKSFEFLPLSGFTHMVPDPAVREQLELRMVHFFQQHLGGPR